MRKVIALLVLFSIVMLIFSCSQQLKDNGIRYPEMNNTDGAVRPVINRSTLETKDVEPLPGENASSKRNETIFYNKLSAELLMKVELGRTIGYNYLYKFITENEFPLLRGTALKISRPPFAGDTGGYIQELRFDFGSNSTGKIMSAVRQDDENVKYYLVFEEGKPIFEYRILLSRGVFRDYLESPIRILGADYIIADANSDHVVLFGKDLGQYLTFQNGSRMKVNRNSIPHSEVELINGREIRYRLYAGDEDDVGVMLGKNETLSSRLDHPEALLSPVFDIAFRGIAKEEHPVFPYINEEVKLDKSGDKYYYIKYRSRLDHEAYIPLMIDSNGSIITAESEDELFHIRECMNSMDYCINDGEKFVLDFGDASVVMRYAGISDSVKRITFKDELGVKFVYDYKGNPGANATTNILYNGRSFPVYIGYDNLTGEFPISVDQNGGGVRGTISRLYTIGEDELRFASGDNYWNITLTIPPRKTLRYGKEDVNMQLFKDGNELYAKVFGKFLYDDKIEDAFLTTDYGSMIRIDNPELYDDYTRGGDVTLTIPLSQALGLVALKGEPSRENLITNIN